MGYRFRLNGLESDWRETQSEEVSYPALPAGHYVFEVEARQGSGDWSAPLRFATIVIEKPFWEEWWFLTVALLLILGAVFGVFRMVLLVVQRRNQLVLAATRAEHEARVSQMNPHFVFNALNSIQSYFLSDDKETANDYLADFSALMRSTLEHSRLQSVSLAAELEHLRLYMQLESMRLEGKFTYREQVDANMNASEVFLPPMLLQPVLENAVWHGIAHKEGAGMITLHAELEHPHLVITVQDNGVGRERSRTLRRNNHRPMASTIMEERIQILNRLNKDKIHMETEDLYASDRSPTGTRVRIYLPFNPPLSS